MINKLAPKLNLCGKQKRCNIFAKEKNKSERKKVYENFSSW